MINGMSNEMHLPTARYVLPSFIEQSAYGTKETNPYAKLFEERIIFLGTQVDDTSANDIMQYVRPDVRTVCLGQAASAAAVLLAAGAPGKRAALPNARVLIHQPATEGARGQVSDLEIQAAEIQRMRTLMEETLARHTGRSAEQISEDTDRDKILTAQEALEYGIIDQVFDYRKLNA